jgi:tryptophanyl-tRNA synthetase
MSLTNPDAKMSKSEPEGAIGLLDSPDLTRKKIMRAQTDSFRDIVFDASRPGLYNLLSIFELLSEMGRPEIEDHFAGKGYGDLKRELADLVVASIQPLQERYRQLEAAPDYVQSILRSGASQVRPTAKRTVSTVRERVGLGAGTIG